MFKLKEILACHDSTRPKGCNPANLGDPVLYELNPVFRSVRNHAIRLGFTYTTEDFCHYTAFHFMALKKILEQKRIFYVDNVSVLREIENERPEYFNQQDLSMFSLFRNPLMHESTHALADDVITRGNPVTSPSQHLTLSRMQLGEAFAIATENLGACEVDNEIHRLFYVYNTPQAFSNLERVALFKQVRDEHGTQNLHRLLILGYFLNLAFFDDLAAALLKQDFAPVRAFVKLPKLRSASRERLARLFELATMNNRFRYVTATNYLRLEGFSPRQAEGLDNFVTVRELFQFDLLKMLESEPCFARAVEQFTGAIETGREERQGIAA